MKICSKCSSPFVEGRCLCVRAGRSLATDVKTLGEEETRIANEPLTLETSIRPGVKVGEYEIDGIIGAGGMSVIYSAIHPVIRKPVAIKVIHKRFVEDPQTVQRFILEARSVNEIGHHHIVDIFSFGVLEDGRCYLVMELLRGFNLRDILIRRGNLSPGHILPLYEQLCDALHAAHAKGFLHRDLKPENLFILRRPPLPFLKIVDFGLAKLRGPKPLNLTRLGMIIGTPEYMSPEQCSGDPVDARTDIYALGVILYELCTGRPPFSHASLLQVLSMQTCDTPCPPAQLAPISPAFEAVVLKALAKNPAERFQSTHELLLALREAIVEPLYWTEEFLSPQSLPKTAENDKTRYTRASPPSVVSPPATAPVSPVAPVAGAHHRRNDEKTDPAGDTPIPADHNASVIDDLATDATSPPCSLCANNDAQGVLGELQASSPDILCVALANLAGFTIASASSCEIEQDCIGNLSAALLGVSELISEHLMRSPMTQTYVKSELGYVIIYNIGAECLLTLLVTHNARLGLIQFEVKKRIAALSCACGC